MNSATPDQPFERPCPACGFCVFTGVPGSLAACPVCGWRDDFEQLVHPDFITGANAGRSLREAQARLRAAPPPDGGHVRDPAWRPLAPGEHPPTEGASSPVCYLGTPAPGDHAPYWLR